MLLEEAVGLAPWAPDVLETDAPLFEGVEVLVGADFLGKLFELGLLLVVLLFGRLDAAFIIGGLLG